MPLADPRTLPTWVNRWHHGYRTQNYGLAGGVLYGAPHIERARDMAAYHRALNMWLWRNCIPLSDVPV